MTVLTYKQANAALTHKFVTNQEIWYAYKQGASKSFATAAEALAHSKLVEPGVVSTRLVTKSQEVMMTRDEVVRSVCTTYEINTQQYEAVANLVRTLCSSDYVVRCDEDEFNLTISQIASTLDVAKLINAPAVEAKLKQNSGTTDILSFGMNGPVSSRISY